MFKDHEKLSICALHTGDTLSYQFHPESVGTTCPDNFFGAMRNFLYNDLYEQKGAEIQWGI